MFSQISAHNMSLNLSCHSVKNEIIRLITVIMIYYKSAQSQICESHWDSRSFRAYTGVQVESLGTSPNHTSLEIKKNLDISGLQTPSKTRRTAWTMARARKTRWISPPPYSRRFNMPTTHTNKRLKMWKWTWKYQISFPQIITFRNRICV